MSLAATSIALGLYALALAPLAWLSTSHGNRTVAAGYVAFILVTAIYHTGVFQNASLAPTDSIVRVLAPTDGEGCREIMDLMERSSLGVDRSDLAAPKLVGQGAEQIPPEVADVLIKCSEAQGADAQPSVPTEPDPYGAD